LSRIKKYGFVKRIKNIFSIDDWKILVFNIKFINKIEER